MGKRAHFQYREFYDVPRALIVRLGAQILFLDCPFEAARDEYPDEYQVYLLPADHPVAETSWTGVELLGQWMGRVPVSSIRFDSTKRRFLDAAPLLPWLKVKS
jgi:hypothetical protein